jgi:hypothetical protein
MWLGRKRNVEFVRIQLKCGTRKGFAVCRDIFPHLRDFLAFRSDHVNQPSELVRDDRFGIGSERGELKVRDHFNEQKYANFGLNDAP